MTPRYPEWIQEQLDKMNLTPGSETQLLTDRLIIHLAMVESRIIHTIGTRLERIEAKIDRLIELSKDS